MILDESCITKKKVPESYKSFKNKISTFWVVIEKSGNRRLCRNNELLMELSQNTVNYKFKLLLKKFKQALRYGLIYKIKPYLTLPIAMSLYLSL